MNWNHAGHWILLCGTFCHVLQCLRDCPERPSLFLGILKSLVGVLDAIILVALGANVHNPIIALYL